MTRRSASRKEGSAPTRDDATACARKIVGAFPFSGSTFGLMISGLSAGAAAMFDALARNREADAEAREKARVLADVLMVASGHALVSTLCHDEVPIDKARQKAIERVAARPKEKERGKRTARARSVA